MLDIDYVIAIHDEIIDDLGGLPGFANAGRGGVESALNRVANHAAYEGLDDVFGIAALYGVAIARGHIFNDANKRTGLACALTYLEQEGFELSASPALEEVMVEVAQGVIDRDTFAEVLYALWHEHQNGA
ncbi:type II toxin-antitoxin system death-on-curing family toxin [Comamonas aquatica]|uniref:type II toxin-antitoxin system death-on-curing family toxin n=1 Tax=Comamonas aquatica TaxID=225991 RepID=UPI003D0556FF